MAQLWGLLTWLSSLLLNLQKHRETMALVSQLIPCVTSLISFFAGPLESRFPIYASITASSWWLMQWEPSTPSFITPLKHRQRVFFHSYGTKQSKAFCICCKGPSLSAGSCRFTWCVSCLHEETRGGLGQRSKVLRWSSYTRSKHLCCNFESWFGRQKLVVYSPGHV